MLVSLSCRIKASLDEKGIPFIPHFYVDTSNASAEALAKTIAQVGDEVDAQYIVVAKSNKVGPCMAACCFRRVSCCAWWQYAVPHNDTPQLHAIKCEALHRIAAALMCHLILRRPSLRSSPWALWRQPSPA